MRTTEEETLKVKQQIVMSAIMIFSSKGYADTNMQDIAEASGVSRGPLYYHYKNKQVLYREAVKFYIDEKYSSYEDIFNKDAHIIDKIREDLYFCTTDVKDLKQDYLTFIPKNREFDDIRKLVESYYKSIYDLKKKSVLKAIDNEEFKENTNPNLVVDLMFVLYEGLANTILGKKLEIPPNELGEIIELIVDLIKNKYCE